MYWICSFFINSKEGNEFANISVWSKQKKFLKYYFLMSFLMKFLLFCSYLTLALKAPTNATCLYSSNTCLLTAKPREEQMSLISLLSFSSSTQTPHFISQLFLKRHDAATVCSETETFSSNLTWIRLLLKARSHVRFWPWFGRLRQILKTKRFL